MIWKKKEGIQWLEFSLLQGEKVMHAIVLRHGGVSLENFASLNMGTSVGDDPVAIQENRNRVKKVFACEELVIGRQVHGKRVAFIDQNPSLESCDGLITGKKGKVLTILHADCQATIFYDPIHHLVANIHCGWKGNVQNIYREAIKALQALGSSPQDILVCISPSLGPNRAEFVHYKEEFPEHFHDFRKEGDLFNLWEISQMQLVDLGILSSHIECASLCTHENKNDFFSHRREKITGRNATIVSLL